MEKIDSIFLFLCILNLILAVSFIFIEVSTTTMLVSAICGWLCYLIEIIIKYENNNCNLHKQ